MLREKVQFCEMEEIMFRLKWRITFERFFPSINKDYKRTCYVEREQRVIGSHTSDNVCTKKSDRYSGRSWVSFGYFLTNEHQS